MRDLNIDFMDLYKRTDRFIKDAYSSSEGVSEYIRSMESCFNRGNGSVQGWKGDYDNLKHMRWIRNQLAHEVSYDSDICSFDDYEWLDNFYKRLFSATDPLGELRKLEMTPSAKQDKNTTDYQQKQSFEIRYSQVNNTNRRPVVNQTSGCLDTFMMMLILSVSIVVSLFILF